LKPVREALEQAGAIKVDVIKSGAVQII